MKKFTVIRIVSFLCAIILVAVGFVIKSEVKNKKYRLQIQNTYSKNFDELTASVNNINLLLQKAKYTNDKDQLTSIAIKLLTEANLSKNALSQLPNSQELTAFNKFLSQVGNYAVSVSKIVINGESFPREYQKNIEALNLVSNKINEIVTNNVINFNNSDYWAKEIENEIALSVDETTLNGSFASLEQDLADYPTLVYDGPYSDHISEKEPQILKSEKKVTKEEAVKIAAKTAECKEKDLSFYGAEQGKIPCYRFYNEKLNITVSQAGGEVIYMRKNRQVEKAVLSYSQALNKAEEYLENLGYINFIKSYYFTDEGVCVVNFVYLDGQTKCYTDQIKVGIAMDNGEIMLYEAASYLTNHTERAFESIVYTKDEAAEKINKSLTIKEISIALIPTEYGKEVRCYEFLCAAQNGDEILVYINVLTLKEEEILILLKSDGGTLVK